MSAKVLVSTQDMPYADWLEYRKQGIGGSDASVGCGISRYKSPVELWMNKSGQLPDQEAGEAAYWGTQLEPFVRAEFTKRTGIEVYLGRDAQVQVAALLFLLGCHDPRPLSRIILPYSWTIFKHSPSAQTKRHKGPGSSQ